MVKMVDNYDYFDNNIFLYCEESVLSKKIRSVNSCILYEPSTQAIHMHKNGSRSNSFRQFMYWCESRIYYIENYSDFSKITKKNPEVHIQSKTRNTNDTILVEEFMNNTDLTMIICVYNCENYIAKTLRSIDDQRYKSFNLIIIDDSSTDKTLDEINSNLPRSILGTTEVVCLQNNAGVAYARNLGMMKARTKYIMYIDADDLLYPEMVEKLISKIESDDELIGVGCYLEYIDELDNAIGGGIYLGSTSKSEFFEKAKGNKLIFMHLSTIINRESALKVGGIELNGFEDCDARFQDYCEDLDLFTRLSDLYTENKALIVLPEVLYKYRKTMDSVSSNTEAMFTKMKYVKHNLIKRRKCEEESTFNEYYYSLTEVELLDIKRRVKASDYYRKAGFAVVNKKFMKGIYMMGQHSLYLHNMWFPK